MPRGATSTRANRSRNRNAAQTTNQENKTMTVTTDEVEMRDDLPFTVDVTPAEEGFKPDRSPAGRKRIPSPFEPLLPELKGKGWQNQPHDGKVVTETEGGTKYNTLSSVPKDENGNPVSDIRPSVRDSNARVILRELSKAVKFLNSEEGGDHKLGLDVNVTESLVQFNVRDKQNRKPRTAPGGGDVTDGEDSDTDSESSVDE